jgi:hypothetical protein
MLDQWRLFSLKVKIIKCLHLSKIRQNINNIKCVSAKERKLTNVTRKFLILPTKKVNEKSLIKQRMKERE